MEETKRPDLRVSAAGCESYAPEAVEKAMDELLSPLDGLDWVRPGMRIAVKVNLVGGYSPEKAVTPHPAVVRALCARLVARGARVTLGDSPGGPFTKAVLEPIYRVTGMTGVTVCGAVLNEDFSETDAEIPGARALHRFCAARWLLEADAVIDLCKLKTHALTAYTGACKNMFGGMAGIHKTQCHYAFPTHERFAQMLVDLCEFFQPRLSLCDAVEALEGNGPTQGTPRHMGVLLASFNPHALDLAGAYLIGLGPDEVPTLAEAAARGLCPERVSELSVCGDLERYRVSDFKLQPRSDMRGWGGKGAFAASVIRRLFCSRPVPGPDCVGCGKCAQMCPAQAISIRGGRAHIDRSKCICCFCCGEFCPQGAVRARRAPLSKTDKRKS